MPARAREWTPVPHLSFPRNEGVPGSSPGVGFQPICRDVCRLWQRARQLQGTKRVHFLTVSPLVKWSSRVRTRGLFAGISRGDGERTQCPQVPGRARAKTAVPGDGPGAEAERSCSDC